MVLEVQHSSPLSIPHSTKQTTSHNIFPPGTDLPTGTVPDTPGPLQRAFDRDPANYSFPWRDADPTPTETYTPLTPVLTPLPGTNMSVGGVDPEFVPLPPSINASTVHLDPMESNYFDIPVNTQQPIDNADILNGIPGPYFVDDHGRCVSNANASVKDADIHLYADSCNTSGVIGYQSESAKLHPYTDTPDAQDDCLRHKQQAGGSFDAARIGGVAQHYQVLPIRLKHNIGERQGRIRKDSVFNKDRDTCNGNVFAEAASAQVQETRDSSGHPVDSECTVPAGSQGSGDDPAQDKAWGGNIGLYDGSGYGEDSSGPITPYEPDEGVKGVHMLFDPRSIDAPPATRQPNRRHREQNASLPEKRCNDPHSRGVSELTVHK
ncbi:hypothetical protein G6514_008459 [Epicoccum nigrum]|nr:hypothetical protein G6514_008459 [Epicoccum nigrum]